MKKKIIGLSIFLLVLLLGLFTRSYAVVNPQLQKLDIPVNTDKQTIFDEVYSHYYSVNINNLNSSQLTNFNNNKTTFINSPISGITYQYNPSGGQSSGYHLNFWSTDNKDKLTFPSTGVVYANDVIYSTCLHGQLRGKSSLSYYSWTESNYHIIQNNSNFSTYYVLQQDKLGYWWEWANDGWSIGSVLRPTFDFMPDASDIIADPMDGEDCYCIQPTQITGYYRLGQFLNWDSIAPIDYQCIIISYENYATSGEIWSTTISDANIYIDSNGVLWFNSLNLYQHYVYWFQFFGIDGTPSEGGFYDIQYYVGEYSLNPSWDTEPLDLKNPGIYIEALVGAASGGGGGHGFGSGDTPGTGLLGGISSFFNGLYEKLFKLDDNSIQDIYDNSVDLLPSGDSPVDFYNTILDASQSSSGDFVISWSDINFDMLVANQHITTRFISGDSINFNAIIRADERISDMWHTFQIILVFTVYYLLFVGWYDCILKLLGVSDGLITEDSDDITTVGTVESVSSSIDMSTGEIKQSNKIRKTNYRRTVSRK